MNFADLLEVAPGAGDALAFRARTECSGYVVTGEVASSALEDTPEDGDRVLEFAVDEFLAIDGDGVTPRREYLVELPPTQHYLGDPPRPAPLPALVYREEYPLGVSLPTPTWRGSRVSLYDTRPEGTPVDLIAGQMVGARDVLPPELTTSEVTL